MGQVSHAGALVVTIGICLIGIGDSPAIVQCVRDAIVVIITVASVGDAVTVDVDLVVVRCIRAVVAEIPAEVVIAIRLIRVGCRGQLSCRLST